MTRQKSRKNTLRQYALYLVRWQVTTLVLAPVIALMAGVSPWVQGSVANLIGGLIFFWVDKLLIFKRNVD